MKLALAASTALACGVFVLFGCAATTPTEEVGHSEQANTAVCTDVEQAIRWSAMSVAPIILPNHVGGLDLANGSLSFQSAEKQLCFGADLGSNGQGLSFSAWGSNNEIVVAYDTNQNASPIVYLQINPGYFGSVDFMSRPGSRFGAHAYSMGVGKQILRDGAPFEITWANPFVSPEIATELYDALMFTFAPTEEGEQDDCIAAGKCFFDVDGAGGGLLSVPALHFNAHFSNIGDAQPTPSTPAMFYLSFDQ